MRKSTFWFPTRSYTNQAVQLQKMARCLKFRIKKVEGLYYLCSENKEADQLRGYREPDLLLCFLICKMLVFLMKRLICFFLKTSVEYPQHIVLLRIRTHLAYIANVKKSCYTKQQSHSFESVRQLTSFNH